MDPDFPRRRRSDFVWPLRTPPRRSVLRWLGADSGSQAGGQRVTSAAPRPRLTVTRVAAVAAQR